MKTNFIIDVPLGNKKEIEKKKFDKISDKMYEEMAMLFQIFSDKTRLRILVLLDYREYTVTELCENINISKSAISHQLKILRAARMVKVRKVRKNSFYSLTDDHVAKILETTIEHIREE